MSDGVKPIHDPTPVPRPTAGRPTKAQQAARQEELLRIALDEFLEKGFDQTSMEGIAVAAGMSKRTIYARYRDKAEIFRAAIGMAVARYTIPRETLEQAVGCDLRATLLNVARLRISNLSRPDAINLQRVLTAQSYQLPELFSEAFEHSMEPTVAFLEEQFALHAARGEIVLRDVRRTVTAFLSLAVGGPARIIVAGSPLPPEEVERHLAFAVDLFLDGIRVRSGIPKDI